jgi:hypothetical protein
VKEGVANDDIEETSKVLYSIDNDDTDATVKSKVDELNKSLPMNMQAVRGRGKYKNKLVTRSKPINTEEMARHAIKATAKKVADAEEYTQLKEKGNFEHDLEELIIKDLGLMRFETHDEEPNINYELADEGDDEDSDLPGGGQSDTYMGDEGDCMADDSDSSDLDLYCDEEYDLPLEGQSDTHTGVEEFNWDDEPETCAAATTTEEDIDDDTI